MSHFYDNVVKTLRKPPERRWQSELISLEPWFRKRSALLQGSNISTDILLDVIKHCKFMTMNKHEVVVLQGQRGDDFFILLRGSVSVLIKEVRGDNDADDPAVITGNIDEDQKAQLGYQVGMLSDGQTFGEQALINEDCVRTATIVTEDTTDLIAINRELYNRSISKVVQLQYQMKLEFVSNHLLFRCWPNRWKKSLALALNKEVKSYEEALVRQGEKADFLYFIISGEVKVSVEPSDHREQFRSFQQKCSLLFDDEEKAGLTPQYFTLAKWVSPKSRVADRLKNSTKWKEDEDYVASEFLPEFKLNLLPSDIRKQNARHKVQKINVCYLEPGDVEFLLELPKYHTTAVCQMQTEVLVLHRVVYERLFRKKNPSTLPLMVKQLAVQVPKRYSRSFLADNVPLLAYIRMMIEHMNGDRKARRKVWEDGQAEGLLRPRSLGGITQLSKKEETRQLSARDDYFFSKMPQQPPRMKPQASSSQGRFSMEGIFLKLMNLSNPKVTREQMGVDEEEYNYLVQLKKRLAHQLDEIHPWFNKMTANHHSGGANAKMRAFSNLRSNLKQNSTPFRSSLKQETERLPKRNVMFRLPRV